MQQRFTTASVCLSIIMYGVLIYPKESLQRNQNQEELTSHYSELILVYIHVASTTPTWMLMITVANSSSSTTGVISALKFKRST